MNPLKIILLSLFAIFFASCSTTKVLQEEEYRLAKNKINVENDKDFNPNQLYKYLKQNENLGWSPFLYVYNWSTDEDTGWNRFLKKIGHAPIVYDPDMVDSSIENILNHLEYLGYYGSEVKSEISVKQKTVKVDYNVSLGKRYIIKDISIEVPDRGEFPAAFWSDSSAITVKKGDYLSEDALEMESQRSTAAMNRLGFYDFNKYNFFYEADTLSYPDSALLNLKINEYTRNESRKTAIPIRKYYIGDVSFTYPKSLKINEKILRDLNTIYPGDIYSPDEINNTYSRLSALQLFSSVNIGMTPADTNKVNCNINLTQSRLQGFKLNFEASVNSSGLLGISPELSYYHKNIFRGGEWLNLSFMGNFQFKFKDTVRSNEFGVSAGLSLPRFFPFSTRIFKGAIPRTEINLSYNYQSRPEYTRNIISTSFGYSGSIKSRFFYQVYPLQLNIVRLSDMDDEFMWSILDNPYLINAYIDHFDFGSGATLYYTTNASTVPTESYFYTRLQFDIAGNLLSAFKPLMQKDEYGDALIWDIPYSQYVRAEYTVGKTWVWGKKSGQSLATRFQIGAGYAYGNSSSLPFEKRFYGGGANSLRGWQARTVGPGTDTPIDYYVIPDQTGDMKIEANIEYRFNIFWQLAGAVFIDAGNVWDIDFTNEYPEYEGNFRWDKFGKSIAADWGIGLRVNLDFLLLRLDFGMKVHDPSREQSWLGPKDWFKYNNCALHFGVGYPF